MGNFIGVTFKLQRPVGIYFTPDGHLLVSMDSVLVFKEDGKFISAIKGTYQGKKWFNNPCGVVMMDSGRIIIDGDHDSNRLVLF